MRTCADACGSLPSSLALIRRCSRYFCVVSVLPPVAQATLHIPGGISNAFVRISPRPTMWKVRDSFL